MLDNLKIGDDVPIFFVPSDKDFAVIETQMGRRKFDKSILLGVASRCSLGNPRVLLCKSLNDGKPFPTNFWLSCPKLVRLAGEIESQGGVGELENFIQSEGLESWIEYNKKHARIRLSLASEEEIKYLAPSAYRDFCDANIGIGGIRVTGEARVKCLHLQVASWLALGIHPGGAWLELKFCNTNGGCLKCGKDE